jgi:cholesterol transport system auxiliary component
MKIVSTRPLRIRTLAAAATPLLALAGCTGIFNSSLPIAQVYVLRPIWSAAAAATPGSATLTAAAARLGSVQVTLPLAAAGLATDSIVVLRSGGRLDYYSAARWAGAVPGMLQTLAIDALRASNRFAMVESDGGPFPSDYVLSLELRHFEAEYTGAGPPRVHVGLVCSLGKRGNREVIVSFTADSQVAADTDRMQAVVAAFERATGDALTQMATNLSLPLAAKP